MSEEQKIFDGDYNLFNNPMVNSAKKSMAQEDLDRYKEWGEAVFNNIDFESGLIEQFPAPMIDALAYVENSLMSGQHPSTLTEDEQDLMLKIRGDQWYKKWGYVEGDLKDIVTVKF